jgi:hypothetical protein
MTYRSAFQGWDERASVRRKPARHPEVSHGTELFFPPEYAPWVDHRLVAERGPRARFELLVHALHQYLHFTTVLEQVAILPVTLRLSRGLGSSGVDIPPAMRTDAFRITTDESWHAQFCHEFMVQVGNRTGTPPVAVVDPAFAAELDQARASFGGSHRALADLTFACVSETLISGFLASVPRDTRLPKPVRQLIADHASDEGRHHAYFRSFLKQLWPALDDAERALVGRHVPQFVHTFLAPDPAGAESALRELGFSATDRAVILGDVMDGWTANTRDAHALAAAGTVRAFADVGALDLVQVRDAFETADLLRVLELPAAVG